MQRYKASHPRHIAFAFPVKVVGMVKSLSDNVPYGTI